MQENTKTLIVNGEILRYTDPDLKSLASTSRSVDYPFMNIGKFRYVHRPMKVDMERLKEYSLLAEYRTGEGFDSGNVIRWQPPNIDIISYNEEVNMEGEEGITTNSGWGYAGFDEETVTYWRYRDPKAERNHCLQILKIFGRADDMTERQLRSILLRSSKICTHCE